MRRCFVIVAATAAIVAASAAPVSADAGGAVTTDGTGADVTAVNDAAGPGDGSTPPCTYRLLDIPADQTVYNMHGTLVPADGTGQWYEKWCGSTFFGAVYIVSVSPTALRDEALGRLNLPLPVPLKSPAGDQIVNLPMWLWINPAAWTTRSASASVPGVTAWVSATPESVIWNTGDGNVVWCGAGTPYDVTRPASGQSTACSHTYTASSAGQPGRVFAASVTVRWRLWWSITGAAGGGPLGTIDRTTAVSVPVAEVQSLNVNPIGVP